MKATMMIAMIAICSFNQASANETVIYGQDDRKDLYEVMNPLHKKWAAATVMLVKTEALQQNASGVMELGNETFGQMPMADWYGHYGNVCTNERFAEQPNPGFCSGSLIGKNLVLTAGHCIQNMDDCSQTSFVFDFALNEAGRLPKEIAQSAVYSCKNIIHSQVVGTGADFAIIETDRDVVGRDPLPLARGRLTAEITNGTKLVMIGHPSGLPTKLDDGAKVRNASPNGFFQATTDSYGGNSGSAVLNLETGEVEGVLVRGENDFNWNDLGSCFTSNICAEDGCSGEDVTKVSSVIPFMPN